MLEIIANTMKIIRREALLIFRRKSDYFYPWVFFLMVVSLFPLSMMVNPNLLALLGPGAIWVAMLLATMLSLTHLYRDDFQDGSLVQMVLGLSSLPYLIFLKLLAQWIMVVIPMVLVSPLVAMMFNLSMHATWTLVLTLILGTPVLLLLGSVGAALTVSLRNGAFLMVLILLPLYIPILIFSCGSVLAVNQGQSSFTGLLLLSAMLVFVLSVTPFISAQALRMGIAYEQ